MARIKIKDLPQNRQIDRKQMKAIMGGLLTYGFKDPYVKDRSSVDEGHDRYTNVEITTVTESYDGIVPLTSNLK
jgi:hypothetical protein